MRGAEGRDAGEGGEITFKFCHRIQNFYLSLCLSFKKFRFLIFTEVIVSKKIIFIVISRNFL